MQNENTILDELNMLKNKYYENNGGKNMIFKKKQKFEIAKEICNNYDLFFLIKKTVFRVKNTDIIFFDYKFYKLFANQSIYNHFIDYIIFLFEDTIQKYQKYTVHIDVDSVTPSAIERYKEILIKFNERCVYTNYVVYLYNWVIYNTPHFIDTFVNLLTVIIHPNINQKMIRYSKDESTPMIEELMKLGTDDIEYTIKTT